MSNPSVKERARTAATEHFGVPPTEDISEFEAGYQTGFVEAFQDFATIFTYEKDGTKSELSKKKLALERNNFEIQYWQGRYDALISLGIAQQRALPMRSESSKTEN